MALALTTEGDSALLPILNADRKKALAKQRERQQLLDFDTGHTILKLHGSLNELADDLDTRVEGKLDGNEKSFFVAYNNFMSDVLKQINELKKKADEEETKTRRDAKIQSLEKELDWFMNEALRLDELCKKYKKELDKWKGKAESLEDDRSFLESQIKTAKRNNKTLRGAVEKAQTSAYSALVSSDESAARQAPAALPPQDQQEALALAAADGPAPLAAFEDGAGPALSRELEERYQVTVKRLKQQLETEQRLVGKLRSVSDRQFGDPSELEAFFVDCVEKVKGQIGERRRASGPPPRAKASGAGGKPPTPDKLKEVTLEDFTATDRRQVVERLMNSEKVLQFLYDKLFPPQPGSPAQLAAELG
jgi:hypothetical protein